MVVEQRVQDMAQVRVRDRSVRSRCEIEVLIYFSGASAPHSQIWPMSDEVLLGINLGTCLTKHQVLALVALFPDSLIE